MALRKKNSIVSESGASASQYDQELENRLETIEAEIKSIKESLNALSYAPKGDSGDKVDRLIAKLNTIKTVTDYCPRGADGVRKIDI